MIARPTTRAAQTMTLRIENLPSAELVSRVRNSLPTSRAGHPVWLRCSSLKYSRYSRSSRLASRVPRSAIWSSFSVDGPLAMSHSRPRHFMIGEDWEIRHPRADRCAVLLRHDADDLSDVPQVVHDPGAQKLGER